MASPEMWSGLILAALFLAFCALAVAAVLLAIWRDEERSTRAGVAHLLAALGALAGAVEQARAEAHAARNAVHSLTPALTDIHREACGPVSLRPAKLPPILGASPGAEDVTPV